MEKSTSRMFKDIKENSSSSLDCYQLTLQLKEILDKDLSIDVFVKLLNVLLNELFKYNLSFLDYIKRVNFIKYEEKYSTKFFRYCFQLKEMKQYIRNTQAFKVLIEAEKILKSNSLGPICFVTPELGRWSTVGGLGVMVDELTQGLVALGQDIIVISPYYNCNRKNETEYLTRDPIKFEYLKNINVQLDQNYCFGIHFGVGNGGIKYYFLHNCTIFPKAYPDGSVSDSLRRICLMGKSTLQLLCDFGIVPALIVTNDWFTGLCAAYSKNGCFGETFKGTTFFHICHNLEATYEGRLYPSQAENTLDHIHQLPADWLVDFGWKQKIINPSRCAIKLSDQWGTVSNSYKRDLMESSPLCGLLNNHSQPFGFPNGIFKENRMRALREKAGSNRDEAKKFLQTKYFGYGDVDLNVPIYSFVGRITQQKGVMLILNAVEQLVQRTSGKINILVGGMGNAKDPYCSGCIDKINDLKRKYPNAFWANPFEFFTDGPLVNLGSDFGLMPSLFEPGGIVQHEFFIAGTPVIAFRTGGLKDTVFEFEWETNKGNGITFNYHNDHDFYNAVERSLNLFHNKDKLDQCRKNAFNSAIDVAEVSRAWCREFCRLRDKIFFNAKDEPKNKFVTSPSDAALEALDDNYIFNSEEIEEDDEEFKQNPNCIGIGACSVIIDGEIHIPVTFNYPSNENKKPSGVQICGSYDKWQVRHALGFDPIKMQWTVTLKMKRGKFSYKYIVDGEWVINQNEPTCVDNDGMINNCITL